VWSVYESDLTLGPGAEGLDAGGAELVAGLAGAFAVRARIQRSLGVLMAAVSCSADEAFAALQLRAVETGATVTEAAERLLGDNRGDIQE
jgi:AmiR/NasT family two-component response regulator